MSDAIWQRLHDALAEAERVAGALEDTDEAPTEPRLHTELQGMLRRLTRRVGQLGRHSGAGDPHDASLLDSVTPHTLSQIVDHLPAMLFLKEPQGLRMVLWNRAGEELVGIPRESMVGKTDFDFFPPEQAAFFVGNDRKVLAGEPSDVEEPIDTPGGRRWLHTRKVALLDQDERPLFLLGVSQDITERRREQRELRRARDAAEAAAQAKSAFLSNVSHELRTPLTLILGPVQLLLERADLDPEARSMLERVQRNAARLLDQVNDLLDLTRLEAGRFEPSWRLVDAAAIVGQLVDDARDLAAQRGLDLDLELHDAPDAPALVPADRRMLEKIVLNLLGNALKFTPAGGRVHLALERDARHTRLRVSDTGIGIDPDKLPLLFERFRQLDDASTRRFAGTGLGLALVHDFVALLGGHIEVDSTPGQGASFTVTLPVLAEHQSAAPDELGLADASLLDVRLGAPRGLPAETVARDAARPTLVLAEDNPELRHFVQEVLAGSYIVHPAEDGRRALELVRALRPDIVLSDIMMPELDGLGLVAAIRADEALAATPVVLLTARAGEESLVGSLETGADDYLAKPFSPPELRARLRAALRIREAQRELALLNDELQRTRDDQSRSDALRLGLRLLHSVRPHLAAALPDDAARLFEHLELLERLEQASADAFGTTDLAGFLPDFTARHGWQLELAPDAPSALIAGDALEVALEALLPPLFGGACSALRLSLDHDAHGGARLQLRAEGVDARTLRERLSARGTDPAPQALLGELQILAAHQLLCAAGGEVRVDEPDALVLRL